MFWGSKGKKDSANNIRSNSGKNKIQNIKVDFKNKKLISQQGTSKIYQATTLGKDGKKGFVTWYKVDDKDKIAARWPHTLDYVERKAGGFSLAHKNNITARSKDSPKKR